jgi:sporulation integral membrane protein YlbJ
VRKAQIYVIALLAACLTLSLVLYPDASLEAARSGLELFLTIVFPSLLPFFILSEVMLGLGVVHFIGVLFEPLMRPCFNVPGEGAFAMSMGLAAGYPMDAVITARFRRMELCNRVEGERLLAFTNTADPLFIFGAVAVGMFAMPALGGTLALAHYMSAVSVGIIFRYHGLREPSTRDKDTPRGHILVRAARALVKAREEDGRALGRMAGDAVNDSVKTLLMICGFIMLFSAFVAIAGKVGLARILGWPFEVLFAALGIHESLVPATVAGLFEIDLGTLGASKAAAPFVQKALIASAIIAWSGLSVHGQVASVITGTDIRMGPYAVARLLHAVFAAVFTVVLVPLTLGAAPASEPVSAAQVASGQALFARHLARGVLWAAAVPLAVALAGAVGAVLATPLARAARNIRTEGRAAPPAPPPALRRSGREGARRPSGSRPGLHPSRRDRRP